MQLLMFCTGTGVSQLQELVVTAAAAGYDGVEGPIPIDRERQRSFRQTLRDQGLVFIAEATTAGKPDAVDWWIPNREKTVAEHLADLRHVVEQATEVDALFVSTMCGCDAWSWQQNLDFFGHALELEAQSGIAISFETHRSRSLFNPWITRDLIQAFPQIKLTCDFSHWCVVCERLIDTEWPILELCAQRALHVQCRVGYAQHAQVSDPRAPEFQSALQAHERWWDLIWKAQYQRGLRHVTMTPEFLYDGYMPTLPYTQAPVADVWQINVWMAARQRQRFAEQYGSR